MTLRGHLGVTKRSVHPSNSWVLVLYITLQLALNILVSAMTNLLQPLMPYFKNIDISVTTVSATFDASLDVLKKLFFRALWEVESNQKPW
jgi:hypothetical protein